MQELELLLILLTFAFPLVFFYYYITIRKKRSRDKLLQHRNDIDQAHLELTNLLKDDHYLARKTIDSWVEKWSFLFPFLMDLKKQKIVIPDLDEKMKLLLVMFENTYNATSERNEIFIQQETKKFAWLFNSVEKYPLTESQIRSIITDEYPNLVIAGAGTGKTSTIVGKAAYILRKGLAKPDEVLLLSFGRDVKKEMYRRIKALGLNLDVKTFHSLGLGIIAEVEDKKPSVSELSTDKAKLGKKLRNSLTQIYVMSIFPNC